MPALVACTTAYVAWTRRNVRNKRCTLVPNRTPLTVRLAWNRTSGRIRLAAAKQTIHVLYPHYRQDAMVTFGLYTV